jgi:hypothetical protein
MAVLYISELCISVKYVQVDLTNRPEDFTALYRSISGDSHLGKVPILLGVRLFDKALYWKKQVQTN